MISNRWFDKNQTSALLAAMEAGQELQTLVKQKAKIKGAKRINQKLALIDYPAISPVGALQQILTQIQERTLATCQGIVTSLSWTSDGQILATGGDDGSVKLWPIEDLDALLVRGCHRLKIYPLQTPRDLQKLTVCQTPELLLASAPNLVEDSEALARAGRIEEAIQGFKTAQQWNPSLRFDPVARAHQLANEAKKEK
jgi:WD40 repeat protein